MLRGMVVDDALVVWGVLQGTLTPTLSQREREERHPHPTPSRSHLHGEAREGEQELGRGVMREMPATFVLVIDRERECPPALG